MSFTAALKRGYKWDLHRDRTGNLPDAISSDPVKIADVNFYLDYLKDKKKSAVDKQIVQLRNLERGGKMKSKEYKLLKFELENPKKEKKKKGEK